MRTARLRGQVRELGSHAELLAQRGLYYRLHELQYSGAAVQDQGE